MASIPPSDDRIVISEEDLDDGGAHEPASPPPLVTPAPASPPPPATPTRPTTPTREPQLVTPPIATPSQVGRQKERTGATAAQPAASGSSGFSLVRLTKHPIISSILAGIVGGVLGGILYDILNDNWSPTSSSNPSVINLANSILVIPAGIAIGFVIASWDDLVSKSPRTALRRGLRGAVYGAVGIYIGQVCGTYLYLKILGSKGPQYTDPASPSYFLARIVALGVLGACVGLALGAANGFQFKRMLNGVIGGTIGGAVGGFVFQLQGNVFPNESQNLLDIVLFACLAIGVALGLRIVERVRRDSWIRITAGPMSGKEFVLYKPETRIGADYRCDIVVAKDTGVEPFHAAFLRANDGSVTVAPFEGSAIRVNGLPSEGGSLKNLDAVIIGGSILTYQERVASK